MNFSSTVNRRQFLQAGVLIASGIGLNRNTSADEVPVSRQKELLRLTASRATKAMQEGDIRAEAYAAAILGRCSELKTLNAFISLDPQKVLEAARSADKRRASGTTLGPCHGLPIPVKDSVNTRDLPTTGGTRALRNYRPTADAALVRTLFDAGAILLGKTNLHEMSFGITSNNLAFGPIHNPYDQSRIPGGSSGGTAVAIATQMAPLGVAEDTAGSVRIPAALCGIAGFRPTLGRYSTQGVIPLTSKFDTLGPHARAVEDLILFDSVVAKEAETLRPTSLNGVRLGVPRTYYWEDLEDGVTRVVFDALQRLKDAGAILVEADVPQVETLIDGSIGPIILCEAVANIEAFLRTNKAGLTFQDLLAEMSPNVRAAFELLAVEGAPKKPSKEAYEAAVNVHRPALQRVMREYFRDHDISAMVFPTTPLVARPIGEEPETLHNGKKYRTARIFSRNIYSGSCAGLPGLALPAGLTEQGLPVGIEFDAASGNDRELLSLGLSLERALGPVPAPQV